MLEKIKEFQLSILGICLALGIIISSVVVTNNISKNAITVTGSAFKVVSSDSASWRFNITNRAANKTDAYKMTQKQIPIVKEYLKSKGIEEKDIELLLPEGYEIYKTYPNGYSSDETIGFKYTQPMRIKSNNVEKIKEISTESQTLLEKGINISSYSDPEYQYSNLAELKIQLLEEATKDAKARANSMLKANRNKVGQIKQVRMGVFQITAPDSNSVSDEGINDSSTIEKKVTAVANVTFSIK
ncbi:SIMPL domain-containing protein [bacterium]|nr:SIMPL domain-containing protein [bacterium]